MNRFAWLRDQFSPTDRAVSPFFTIPVEVNDILPKNIIEIRDERRNVSHIFNTDTGRSFVLNLDLGNLKYGFNPGR